MLRSVLYGLGFGLLGLAVAVPVFGVILANSVHAEYSGEAYPYDLVVMGAMVGLVSLVCAFFLLRFARRRGPGGALPPGSA